MSTTIMAQCWPLEMPPSPKAVLISLADQANDQGVCWPSVGSITKRTCLSERTVQAAIQWLQASGALTLNRAQGRATTYQVLPANFKGTADLFTAPARTAPPQPSHPRSGCGTPPQQPHPTPAAVAGDPRSGCTQNHKRTNKEPKAKGRFDAGAIELPAWLDRELWTSWCNDRRSRGKAITEAAAHLQIAKLDAYRADGHTPKVVIEHSIAGGFQGLYAPSRRAGDPAPAAADTGNWFDSVAGIRAKGVELQVGDWDRDAWEKGRGGDSWPTYRAKVFKAAGHGTADAGVMQSMAGVLKAVAA